MELDRETASREADADVGGDRVAAGAVGQAFPRRALARAVLLFSLAVLVSLAVAVIFVLPQHVDPVVQPVGPVQSVPVAPAPPTDSETRRARHRRDAEKALEAHLKRLAELEAQEAATWGGREYEEAAEALAQADAYFAKGEFEQARSGYEAATRVLASLEASMPRKLEQALSDGADALGRYDAPAARRQFEIALALDPGNARALAGAARARIVERLAGLLDQAAAAEAGGDLGTARDLLAEAAVLDPLDPRARSELDRVGAALEARAFDRHMSAALTAIEAGRFDDAAAALSSAEGVRSGVPDLADARNRLRSAIQARKIDEHRERAEEFERAEQWHGVNRELEAVLAIDPQAQFAAQGLARGRRLAALHDQLDHWLHDPGRLGSSQPRQNARTLLDSPAAAVGAGPRLRQKLDQLGALLVLAETPVAVSLVSDGQTDVTINRVGRFGSFKEKTVKLLPGSYVVRGERIGYRDVRRELKVALGATDASMVIQCEERI